MGTFQLVILVIIGSLLLYFGYSLFFPYRSRPRSKADRSSAVAKSGVAGIGKTCPLCEAGLMEGERVRSVVYPAMEDGAKRMFIYGCPYCLGAERSRRCPVCGKNLGADDYLIAKLFPKPGRSHVHVQGCSLCRRSKF